MKHGAHPLPPPPPRMPAGHVEQSFSTEFEERKRGWTRCECPIVVAGTLAKKFNRHSTGKWQWDDARAIALAFEKAGSWTEHAVVVQPLPDPHASSPHRIETAVATKLFLDELKETAAFATHKTYRLLLARFENLRQLAAMFTSTSGSPSTFGNFVPPGPSARKPPASRRTTSRPARTATQSRAGSW